MSLANPCLPCRRVDYRLPSYEILDHTFKTFMGRCPGMSFPAFMRPLLVSTAVTGRPLRGRSVRGIPICTSCGLLDAASDKTFKCTPDKFGGCIETQT